MMAVKRFFLLAVATTAGAVERVAGRIRERSGLAYILSDIETVNESERVEITFEEHANPDFIIVRGRRGKALVGFVSARANVDEVVAEITRMLNETEPRR